MRVLSNVFSTKAVNKFACRTLREVPASGAGMGVE